ncbi:MAG: hypothetical protein QXK37_01890 [Candidatus Woesearchaeota archaeon]
MKISGSPYGTTHLRPVYVLECAYAVDANTLFERSPNKTEIFIYKNIYDYIL